MTIVQINLTSQIGSTGKIMYGLNEVIQENGSTSYMVAGYAKSKEIPNLYALKNWHRFWANKKDIFISRLTGKMGYRYKNRTRKLIQWIDDKKPDVIHLHNIHGDWINVKTLFKYIKSKNTPVVWTLHDCWSFTGRCAHFELFGCQKWRTGCFACKNKRTYPITYFFDSSKKMWKDKKEWFLGVKNMTLVTPSAWLANYVKQSFLKDYPVKVIHNGIDTTTYSPQENRSKYYKGFENKFIILGVANSWSAKKGYDDMLKLDTLLDHEQYQMVMVGLNSRQLKELPKSIIGIARTTNEQELVELYSGANVLFNPTKEEVFGMVNIEAQACGTPVITYRSGGSPETVVDVNCIFEQGDILGVKQAIEHICQNGCDRKLISQRAKTNFYTKNLFLKYYNLYDDLSKLEN